MPVPHATPDLPHYLTTENEMYTSDHTILRATAAGWPTESVDSNDREIVTTRDHRMLAGRSNTNRLHEDSLTCPPARIHFFRYNRLSAKSQRACSKRSLSKFSHEYNLHRKKYDDKAKDLQSKVFGLPEKAAPIEKWRWSTKLVLAVVSQYDGVAFLKNLLHEYSSLGVKEAGECKDVGLDREQKRKSVKRTFESYKDSFLAKLEQSLLSLKHSDIPDNNRNSKAAKDARKREVAGRQAVIDQIKKIKLPRVGGGPITPQAHYYHELAKLDQERI